MKKPLLVLILAVFATVTFAQTKRALFIGINTYKPDNAKSSPEREAPPNLAGCVNDALAMKEMMQIRFGFEEKNISTLYNQDASRARIIGEIEKLIEISKKGDVVFIFYAGHGSQVKNSLSVEADKLDETIVPADAYKGEKDIRDKELAVLLNKLIDKGVIVTAIFDSCHSGSLSRGPGDPPKYRFTSGDNRDVKDPEQPEPAENRGALIISASRDKEPAQEIKDEHGMPHGGFTVALLEILRTESPSASVSKIFRRVEAVMLYNNLDQKAVLAANEERRNGNLLGIGDSLVKNDYEVPVITMEGDLVVLNAGFATGISPKTILKKLTNKGFVILEVVRVESINKSYAKINENPGVPIIPGEGFKIENLVLSPEAAIKIYVFNSNYTAANLTSTVNKLAAAGYNFSNLPSAVPYQSVYFDNNKWQVAFKDKKTVEIGADINKEKLAAKMVKDSLASFTIPATQNLGKLLKDRFSAAGTVKIVNSAADADYHLVGRWKDGKVEYAFVNPNRMFGVNDSNNLPLPIRTNYFAVSDAQGSEKALTDSLQEYI
ncbi:MAG TPA: caspase family protein, partial [Bacteroidia bacterium]|nr:caspase family protein [Bacteroidia bacterium]